MNTNKSNYFNTRNNLLKNHSDRRILGEREVQTLLRMISVDIHKYKLKGKSVVDLGCGDQNIREAFENRGASYRGIDINECNLEIENFPLETESIDIAVCLALIEHINDPGHFLKETKRILKPGGVLWISTPNIEACGEKFWDDPTHVHPYTRASLRMLLEMNGFKVLRLTPNYRCKPKSYYLGRKFDFFRSKYLMPFKGTSKVPVPSFLKGGCSGLFVLGSKKKE